MQKTLLEIWQTEHGSDFATGVQLLAANGGEQYLTRNLWQRMQGLTYPGAYVDTYHAKKLAWAIERTTTPPPTPPPGERGAATSPASPKGAAPATEKAPVTSEKAKNLHKKHGHEHALMVTAKTDEARAEHATTIMEEIVPQLDAEYDRLRSANDESPLEGGKGGDGTAPILNSDDFAALKKLQSVRARISTLKGKIKKEKDPARQKDLEQQLTEKEAERDRLDALLSS